MSTDQPAGLPPNDATVTRQLPMPGSEHLVGREALLCEMERHLQRTRLLVLYGAAGCGRTALVTEYLYRHVPAETHAWYVRARDRGQLTWDYVALRGHLGVVMASARDQVDVVARVCEELSGRKDWVLVFDGATSPESLHDFLPAGEGRVIVVSDGAEGWPSQPRLNVPPLSVQEIALCAGVAGAMHPWAVGACEGRPLAAVALRAWASTGPSVADGRVMHELSDCAGWRGVLKACCLRCRNDAAEAWQLLLVLCWYNGEDVAGVLLRDGLPFSIDAARQALGQCELIGCHGEQTWISPEVQASALNCATLAEKAVSLSRAIRLLYRAFPAEVRYWKNFARCAELIPHVHRLSTLSGLTPVDERLLALLLNRAGLYLVEREQFGMAHPLLEAARDRGRSAFGESSAEVSQIYNSLGLCLRGLGDLEGALSAAARAFDIALEFHGPEHPVIGARASNLGLMYRLRDRPEEACRMYCLAYESLLRHEGRRDPRFPLRAHNYGQVLRGLGAAVQARRLLARAVNAESRIHGATHPRVAYYCNALGELLIEQKDLVKARHYVERAKSINLAFYGDNPQMRKQIVTGKNLMLLDELQA